MKLLVSACLMGLCTRFDGESKANSQVLALAGGHSLIPVCPEQLGGLPTPRPASELRGGRVINRLGVDVTAAFVRGAEEACQVYRLCGCEAAVLKLKLEPFADINYAKVDGHRAVRQGISKVIYGAGKTPDQIIGIAEVMVKSGQETVLITRMNSDAAAVVGEAFPLRYSADCRIGIIGRIPEPDGRGDIVVATGGTTDIPVAEEAALTAEALGNQSQPNAARPLV